MLNFTEHSMLRIAHAIYNNSVQHFILPRALMAVVLLAVCINYISRTILQLLAPSQFLKILTQNELCFNSNPRCIDAFQMEKEAF